MGGGGEEGKGKENLARSWNKPTQVLLLSLLSSASSQWKLFVKTILKILEKNKDIELQLRSYCSNLFLRLWAWVVSTLG